jgi:hypothetical protein|tara:strand:+ start:128 stop:640 length:513 start_codon:yes stop_codon:yes gene_type:complete
MAAVIVKIVKMKRQKDLDEESSDVDMNQKRHENQEDVQTTFNVKNNQTFTQIAGKHQGAKQTKSKKTKKKEMLAKAEAKKKSKEKESTNGDVTMKVYNEEKRLRGAKFDEGYSTSSSDDEQNEDDEDENKENDNDNNENGKKQSVGIDDDDLKKTPQEIYDAELEEAIKP